MAVQWDELMVGRKVELSVGWWAAKLVELLVDSKAALMELMLVELLVDSKVGN